MGALTEEDRLDWLHLARTPRIGPVTFFQLLKRFGTARTALQEAPKITRRSASLQVPPRDLVKRELEATEAYGARLTCACEPDYPVMLAHLAPPPPVLTVLGDAALAAKPCIAMVGARQASAAGRKLARDIARDLSKAGYVIVSGLARGIDGEAHAASLEGGTVAVLGGGIDHIYPQQHDRLYAAIAQKGAIVSESPFGYRAQARDFPRRNRIITGIASGVVVIEAAERSGSLISARTALEQNREVMAIPGSPLEPRAAGNNKLLRQGAILVRNAADIIEALPHPSRLSAKAPQPTDFEDFSRTDEDLPQTQIEAVLSVLGPHPMPIAEIARAASVGAGRCAAILAELEISGEIVTLPGGLAVLDLG